METVGTSHHKRSAKKVIPQINPTSFALSLLALKTAVKKGTSARDEKGPRPLILKHMAIKRPETTLEKKGSIPLLHLQIKTSPNVLSLDLHPWVS